MFRYAWCGYTPRRSVTWLPVARPRPCYSWHTGPVFGIRRPLRHLAYKLDLDDAQMRELAAILDRLKTARAQVGVDWRRSTSELADTVEGESFDEDGARSALERRARSADALRDETLDALRRLHRLLDPQQRRELAYLLRSGGLWI